MKYPFTGSRTFLLFVCCVVGSPVRSADMPAEWLSDASGVLELQLAHAHPGRIDGGTLRMDRRKRVMLWVGAPGDIGCKESIEASFDDVKSVTVGDAPGFFVELKSGKTRKLRLIPVPHAAWLARQSKMQEAMATSMKYGSDLQTTAGKMEPTGAAAGGGPTLRMVEIPKDVADATKRAIDAIKHALEDANGS
jgi:hypothetical protein